MLLEALVQLGYLIGSVSFVWGLRLMSSPDSAAKGNKLAGIGMGIAILAALAEPIQEAHNNYLWIVVALLIGGAIGWTMSSRIKMTAMPQLVSIFNGLGGACATLLGISEGLRYSQGLVDPSINQWLITLITVLIGAVSFSGSLLAYGKLDGKVKDQHVTFKGQGVANLILLVVLLSLAGYMLVTMDISWTLFLVFLLLCLVYGVAFVAPIGGADMPVVISLLNSFTGLSSAAAGLLFENQIMLVGGILVGAAGTILTVLMCKAMNRSLMNVLIGGFGSSASSTGTNDAMGNIKEIQLTDLAIQLYYANSVMFVPGYGLAVAQAQKAVKELDDLLSENGVDVTYAIHPVAGRMPGHMNVLLAEADVPYPKLKDLEEANDLIPQTDVIVVVGANDVVNPAAVDEPSSPIFGMPVLEVWKATHTVVLKRSMGKGYAGIVNPLFYKDNNYMLFGDAKDSIQKINQEIKNL